VQSSTEVAGIKNLDPDGNGTAVNAQGYTNPVVFHPYSYYQVWDSGYAISAGLDYGRLVKELVNVSIDVGDYSATEKMVMLK
jgi:hypothetical protein